MYICTDFHPVLLCNVIQDHGSSTALFMGRTEDSEDVAFLPAVATFLHIYSIITSH
jgi:hypothetical protein